MVTLYSKIFGAPIFEMVNQEKVGTVFDLIYDPSSITLAGIILNKGIFERKVNVISVHNIIEIATKDTTVLVDNYDAIQNLDDLVRLKSKTEKGFCGIGQKVFTKSGQFVGKVSDILVDGHSFELRKFYIKNLLSERIISHSAVINFAPNQIVIKDDFERTKVQTTVETSPA
jgi:uncharacterized protein YrrD